MEFMPCGLGAGSAVTDIHKVSPYSFLAIWVQSFIIKHELPCNYSRIFHIIIFPIRKAT